ncbi:MAG TPA: hypothetical protein VFE58_19810 [Tepidisphaeraceae bacterium]|jgi:hypothetical protein|nr:hypothetical protein [Tepidisphaeraceae bacterium]
MIRKLSSAPRPSLIEPLEPRQLFASISIASLTSHATILRTTQALDTTVAVTNTGTGVELSVAADVFLVPQGQSLDVTTDAVVSAFNFKPIAAKSARQLTHTALVPNVSPGNYSLVACLLSNTGTPDTSVTVNGPTITFIAPPAPDSLIPALTLVNLPTRIKAGTKLTTKLSLTSKTNVAKSSVPISFYISADRKLSAKDVPLPAQNIIATLTADHPTIFKLFFTIPPQKLVGNYYLIAVVNSTGSNPAIFSKVPVTSASAFKISR